MDYRVKPDNDRGFVIAVLKPENDRVSVMKLAKKFKKLSLPYLIR